MQDERSIVSVFDFEEIVPQAQAGNSPEACRSYLYVNSSQKMLA